MHRTAGLNTGGPAAAAVDRVDIPQTDNGRHFCLSYHLKGVSNTNCVGRNSHRPLSHNKFRRLGEWRNRYCGRDEDLPVQEVDTGVQIQASTLSAQTGRL